MSQKQEKTTNKVDDLKRAGTGSGGVKPPLFACVLCLRFFAWVLCLRAVEKLRVPRHLDGFKLGFV